MIKKGDKRIVNGWAFYDWANSVYPLVITSSIFPIFYNYHTKNHESGETVINFLGFELENTQIYTLTISLAFLIVSVLSPILSGIADFTGSKKTFLKIFCYIGAISCASMYFFGDLYANGYFGLGLLSILLASVGFWGSLVFYNAYLPEIAEPKDHDKISAKGFSLGYFGSSILLILCLVLVQSVDAVEDKMANMQICFLLVAVWWIGFSQITYRRLPGNVFNKKPKGNLLLNGYKELIKVQKQLVHHKYLAKFLSAFFIFSMGLQTIFIVATPYADKTLGIESGGMIVSILIIQFVAIGGSVLFSRISRLKGNVYSLSISLIIWVLVCVGAYAFLDGKDPNVAYKFYVVAAVIGFVMGGVQALSRSTYSKLLPDTQDHASFFSFFDISEKIGIVVGTATWAILEGLTGPRVGILSLALFFIVGLLLLFRVPNKIFLSSEKKENIVPLPKEELKRERVNG